MSKGIKNKKYYTIIRNFYIIVSIIFSFWSIFDEWFISLIFLSVNKWYWFQKKCTFYDERLLKFNSLRILNFSWSWKLYEQQKCVILSMSNKI